MAGIKALRGKIHQETVSQALPAYAPRLAVFCGDLPERPRRTHDKRHNSR